MTKKLRVALVDAVHNHDEAVEAERAAAKEYVADLKAVAEAGEKRRQTTAQWRHDAYDAFILARTNYDAREKHKMTLEEKRVALEETFTLATEKLAKASRRRINADHESRMARSAEEDAKREAVWAKEKMGNFRAFYDPGT